MASFLVLGLSAVCTLRNEWALLHVYYLYRNVSTSIVRRFGLRAAFYLGYIAISLRCSSERTLSDRLVSCAAWQFLVSPLCF